MTSTSEIHFYKLQANGNDFVAIDNLDGRFSLQDIVRITPILCKRRFGVGADGLLALFPPENKQNHFTMIYRNADGSDAGMCGNGGRCLARLATELGLPKILSFTTHGDCYKAHVGDISVSLELPSTPSVIQLPDEIYGTIYVVNTGTDHIVISTASDVLTNSDALYRKGRKLRYDQRFSPKGTNVNFFTPLNHNHIRMATYERGVEDLTLACGTGSVAAAIVHEELNQSKLSSCGQRIPRNKSNCSYSVKVTSDGGETIVHFEYNQKDAVYKHLVLEGPADVVFSGVFHITSSTNIR
jgi:diaminopimelate epimerase